MLKPYYTALIQREGDMCVAFCPELDIASQGETVEIAKANLREAVELFLETASMSEIVSRSKAEFYVSSFEVQIA